MEKLSLLMSLLLVLNVFAADLYVVNSISQTLSKIDLETNEVNNTFAILGQTPGSAANKIAFYNGFAYVVITYENAIQKINLESGLVRSYIFLEDSSTPNDIIIKDGFAYISGNVTNKVYKINLENDEVIAELEVGLSPQGMAISEEYLYVANTGYSMSTYTYDQGTVSKIDLTCFTLETTIETDLNPGNLTKVDNNIHVVCTGNYVSEFGKINIINSQTDEIETTIELGGSPGSIANYQNQIIFVGNCWPAGVYAYNPETYEIIFTPNDNILSGGNSISVFEDNIITVDAFDYQQNSLIRVYQAENYELLNEYEVAVGATDAKVYPEEILSDEQVLQNIDEYNLRNYPNPFNPSTTIYFSLSENDYKNAQIIIYNLKGQKIKSFPNLQINKLSNKQILWNGTDDNNQPVSSGIYFYKLKVNNTSIAIKKMLLIK